MRGECHSSQSLCNWRCPSTVNDTSKAPVSIGPRVCKSGYPLSGYPDLSVNFMAAKNPDILVANPDIRYQDIQIFPLILWQPKI